MSTSASKNISKKSQVWYMDFAIGLFLFIFTLVVYFNYTTNFQQQDEVELDNLLSDAKSISSSLALSGYPKDWNNISVVRIGIVDNENINITKLKSFKQLNYDTAKRLFATPYDYFVFFVNRNDEVLNIGGTCGSGNLLVNITYNIKIAYYYSDHDDEFLKEFMNQTFGADIYFGDNPSDINDIDSFMSNLSKYGLVVMEHPDLTSSNFNQFKDKLNNHTSNGSLVIVSGQLTSAQGSELFGSDFYKKAGQSISDRNSTVNNTEPYLSFNLGDSIVFSQAYYVENKSNAKNFKQIATFNQDGRNAVSKWSYGNGTVYTFSDFDVSYFNQDFVKVIEDLAQVLVGGTCNLNLNLNISNINQKKLVKTERYLSYNSDIVKMIVYVWQ